MTIKHILLYRNALNAAYARIIFDKRILNDFKKGFQHISDILFWSELIIHEIVFMDELYNSCKDLKLSTINVPVKSSIEELRTNNHLFYLRREFWKANFNWNILEILILGIVQLLHQCAHYLIYYFTRICPNSRGVVIQPNLSLRLCHCAYMWALNLVGTKIIF